MKKCLFVIEDADSADLKKLASDNKKTMSELIRQGIGLLKLYYNHPSGVYTDKNTEYIPKQKQESGLNGR